MLDHFPCEGCLRPSQRIQDAHVQDGVLQAVFERRRASDRPAEGLALELVLVHHGTLEGSRGAVAVLAGVVDSEGQVGRTALRTTPGRRVVTSRVEDALVDAILAAAASGLLS